MKNIIEFDGYEDKGAFEDAINGTKYRNQIEYIWEKCFRPNNKHGYNDDLLDSKEAYEIIEKIAKRYLDIINEEDL